MPMPYQIKVSCFNGSTFKMSENDKKKNEVV